MQILIAVSQIVTLLGSEFTKFAIPIWLYERSGSALSVTTAFLVSFLPNILLGPFVGTFVDQCRKKQTLIICEFGQALSIAGLFVLTQYGGQEKHLDLLIYLALGVQALFSLFQYPAFAAIVPQLFQGRQLQSINSILSMAESASVTAGPILAGFSLQFLQIGSFLVIDAASFVISGLLLFFLPAEPRPTGKSQTLVQVWSNTFANIRSLTLSPTLLRFLLMGTSINFAMSLSYGLISPYLKMICKDNLNHVGLITGSAGGMELVGAALVMFLPEIRRRANFQVWCILAMGLFGSTVIGISTQPLIAGAAYSITLFLVTLINTVNRTAWQKAIPSQDLGKFFAFKRTVSSCVAPVGFLLSGFIFDYVFRAKIQLSNEQSFRALFLLSGTLLILVFALNFRSKWIGEFDGIREN